MSVAGLCWVGRVEVVSIVKFDVPTAVDRVVATVRTLDPEPEPLGIEVGLKVPVTPLGSPVVPRLTAPVKPLKRFTVTL